MSLTMVLKAIDGLVLAADSRMTEGYTLEGPKIRDDSEKFIQLNADVGVLTYGLSDIGHAGLMSLKEIVSQGADQYTLMSSILDKGMEVFKKTSCNWSKENPAIKREERDVGFIISGYERREQELEVFNVQSPEFIPKKLQGGCLLAGQWHVARFIINKIYSKDMSVKMLNDLAFFILYSTISVEKTVGGEIRLATITKSKGFQWISHDEINEISKRHSSRQKIFRKIIHSSLLSLIHNNNKKNGLLQDVK